MDAIKDSLLPHLLNPHNAPYLSLLKAFRNGLVYGAKVRFPHALVMVFLFRSGPLREKLLLVFKATRTHARNLGMFALVYKSGMVLLKQGTSSLNSLGRQEGLKKEAEADWHSFAAGLVGGYVVFGRGIQSSVNQQIVIYVFARVVLALAKLAVQQGKGKGEGLEGLGWRWRERVRGNAWPIFASLSWAMVMWVFRWYPEALQPSLRSSMKYIYVDSDHWDSFRNFLVHNK